MEASFNISAYLNDQKDEGIDNEGNTPLHQAVKSEGFNEMETFITLSPHMLYLLNKSGCTPLCVSINEHQDQKAIALIEYME